MRIAIPATEESLNSKVSQNFSRCSFFCFYNTKNKKTDFRVNTMNDGGSGIGQLVIRFLANNRIEKIIACELGSRVKELLEESGIEIEIISDGKTIRETIDMLNN